jgi:hypothetical protein
MIVSLLLVTYLNRVVGHLVMLGFDYLMTLVKAYNPNQYEKLIERPLREHLRFLLATFFLCMLIFTILFIPITFNYIRAIPAMTAEMQTLELDASVAADHRVTLLPRPNIVLDLTTNATERDDEDLLITQDALIYPRYLLFGDRSLIWGEVRDLKTDSPSRDLFLIPSVLFWFFLYELLILFIIFWLLVLLGYCLPRLAHHRITFRETIKIAILAMPSVMIMGLGLFPIAPLFWWGVLLTAIVYALGIALHAELAVDDHGGKHGMHRRE